MTTKDIALRNRFSLVGFGVAKVCGIMGVMLAYTTHRIFGGCLLAIDGLLLIAVITTCYNTMRAERKIYGDAVDV